MRGIKFETVWWDQDVVEYRVRCSNGLFSGEVDIYANHDDLHETSKILSGFPRDTVDSRNIELGTMDPDSAGGGIQIDFHCVDLAGHAVAKVKLRVNGCERMGEAQSVCLLIPVEAGAIDSFISQARSIEVSASAGAYLAMADHTKEWVQNLSRKAVKHRRESHS